MESLEQRMRKVIPGCFSVASKGGLIIRKNIQMTSNKVMEAPPGSFVRVDRVQFLPGDGKKLRGHLTAPVTGWVTVTSGNLKHIPEKDTGETREAWEFDTKDSYDHYLTPSERCAWPVSRQRLKVMERLHFEFANAGLKLPKVAPGAESRRASPSLQGRKEGVEEASEGERLEP